MESDTAVKTAVDLNINNAELERIKIEEEQKNYLKATKICTVNET